MTTASLLRAGVAGSITVWVILGAAVPAEALSTASNRDATGRVIKGNQPSTTASPTAKLRKTATTTTVPLARVLTPTSVVPITVQVTPVAVTQDAAGIPVSPTGAPSGGVGSTSSGSSGVVVSGPFYGQVPGTSSTGNAPVIVVPTTTTKSGSTASKGKKSTTPLLVNGEPYVAPSTTAAPATQPTSVPTITAPTTTAPKKVTPTTVLVTPPSPTVVPVVAAGSSDGTTPPASSVVITPAYRPVDSSQLTIVNTAPPTTAPAPSASTTTVPAAPLVFAEPSAPAPEPHPRAAEVVAFAMTQLGVPYVWAGDSAEVGGFDCSGLTMRSWAQVGVALVHQSGQQYLQTVRVSKADLRPGDLVFFGSPIHHVGLYVGEGKMIEAPRAGANVRLASINRRDLVGAGRIVAR